MNSRPNEAQEVQELYDAYGYSYDGDEDAYENWPDDDLFDAEVLDTSLLSSNSKRARSNRRRADARAKQRLFETAAIAAKNLRARLSHADRHPNAPIPKYQVAKRLLSTAQKMGMDI